MSLQQENDHIVILACIHISLKQRDLIGLTMVQWFLAVGNNLIDLGRDTDQ
jgi:hypothetical protein